MPRSGPTRGSRPDEWLALGPASQALGVDPDTLRRWADTGRVRAWATPGGHRRFSRTDVDRMATARRPVRRPLASLGATPDRVTRAYARSYRNDAGLPPLDRLDADARTELRTEGRRLVAALLAYLDATTRVDRDRWETEAMGLMSSTAQWLAESGATTAEVVEIYLRARQPLMGELGALGRHRALDADRLAALFEQAIGLLDRLLLHLVATHAGAQSPAQSEEVAR